MTRLSSQKILEENQSNDPASITTLKLNHKALSDISCLSDFKNLEKLDLSFNNLSSLQDLRSCINLKWLSVSQNKLQNLQGIENLTKLTVLNAGRNRLRSMDEIRSLINLRALILNDNEISSVCRLDQLMDLNTLVLSRNPIRDIGDSLVKLKSITKLSLSNCQLQTIETSLGSLLNLKEFRLAHNEIKTLPAELTRNIKLQNLDLGNNSITSLSELKVLSSLHNLKNLNLQGNPITENDKIANKIKKLVPGLQIFNARPIERSERNGNSKKADNGHFSLNKDTDPKEHKEQKIDNLRTNEKISRKRNCSQEEDNPADKAKVRNVERKVERKKPKTNTASEKDISSGSVDDIVAKKEFNRQLMKADGIKRDPIDDGEIPFIELISDNIGRLDDFNVKKIDQEAVQDIKSLDGGIVRFPTKRKKASKNPGMGQSALQFFSPANEVGSGGPSAWDA